MKRIIYLAAPYSGSQEEIAFRMREVNRVAAEMMMQEWVVFSPLSMAHSIAVENQMNTSWEFWSSQLESFLTKMSAVVVLMLPGYEKSTGVRAEEQMARRLEIPIFYLDPSAHVTSNVFLTGFITN